MSWPARPWSGRRMHFVGVGGAGMSGYARAAHALGARSAAPTARVARIWSALRADGVLEAHDRPPRRRTCPRGDGVELFYSIGGRAGQRRAPLAARERGIPERPRAELLAELSAMRRTIAVAGTHGKTTTASMLAHALRARGHAARVAGGRADRRRPGERGVGGGRVAGGRGRRVRPLDAEPERRDRGADERRARPPRDVRVAGGAARGVSARSWRGAAHRDRVWDRPELLALRERPRARRRSRPLRRARAAARRRAARAFDWRGHDGARWRCPGAHNALDAAGALEAARLAGARGGARDRRAGRLQRRRPALSAAGRRAGGARVYEDYAHHPTEIAATLRAARTLEHRRLVAVFQPHLYSRTALLAREFGAALARADVVVVLDVYPARERAEDHPGVSGLLVAEAAADAAAGRPVYWLPGFADARARARGLLRAGRRVRGDGRRRRRRAGARAGGGE